MPIQAAYSCQVWEAPWGSGQMDEMGPSSSKAQSDGYAG